MLNCMLDMDKPHPMIVGINSPLYNKLKRWNLLPLFFDIQNKEGIVRVLIDNEDLGTTRGKYFYCAGDYTIITALGSETFHPKYFAENFQFVSREEEEAGIYRLGELIFQFRDGYIIDLKTQVLIMEDDLVVNFLGKKVRLGDLLSIMERRKRRAERGRHVIN